MSRTRSTPASALPTKLVRAEDGSAVRMKVVQSSSPTLGADLLGAFRSNVKRLRSERRKMDGEIPA